MSRTPSSPPSTLTPRFCFDTTALRDFLRQSRAAIDDTISQNLDALATPGTSAPFDPASTGARRFVSRRGALDAGLCEDFKRRLLYPSWQARADVLDYCGSVAERDAEGARHVEERAVVDERRDPYSSREPWAEARAETLAAVVRMERTVEDIVRTRTCGIIQQRCGEQALDKIGMLAEWRNGKWRERHD